jgi:hypothetical protein
MLGDADWAGKELRVKTILNWPNVGKFGVAP